MRKVYLDNAATTPLLPEVVDYMCDVMKNQFGNPSSTHYFGQESKAIIENARIKIAKLLGAHPTEIIFTSCGTESNNLIIRSCVDHLGIERIITTSLEHKCVLETTNDMHLNKNIELVKLSTNAQAEIDLAELEQHLKNPKKTLVSIMHANNEFGNLNDIEKIGALCEQYQAFFHSDTVQTVGHYNLNYTELPVDFASASAHKFHGPKGIGFAYIKKSSGLKAKITGGGQERNMRSGTENTYGIAGMEKALTIAYEQLEKDKTYISELKSYAIQQFQEHFPKVSFNGYSGNVDKSLYTLLNVFLPFKNDIIGFQLDIKGIAISQGSACSSGASKASLALQSIRTDEELNSHTALRISFSKHNTKEDIDYLLSVLKEIQPKA